MAVVDKNDIDGASSAKPAKRAKWTAVQRQEAVTASLVTGASINDVAERFGVQPSLLSTWRRKHAALNTLRKPASKSARFAAVRVKEPSADGLIEIDPVTRCVRVRGIVDAGMLREVLAATR